MNPTDDFFETLARNAPAEELLFGRGELVVGPVRGLSTPARREHTSIQNVQINDNETAFIVQRDDLADLHPLQAGDTVTRLRDGAFFVLQKKPDWRYFGSGERLVRVNVTFRKGGGETPPVTPAPAYVVVATRAERDAIPVTRRRPGLVALVESEKSAWILSAGDLGNSGWRALVFWMGEADGHDVHPATWPEDGAPVWLADGADAALSPEGAP